MANKTYTSTTRRVTARPRNKRLRECGGAAYTAALGSSGTSGTSGTSAAALAAQVAELTARLSELRSQVETLALRAGAEV